MPTNGKLPRKLALDDECTRADNFFDMDVFDDHDFVHILELWIHLVKTLCKLLF